jgi:transcriptional regulator with XRE-family HTH domain
MAHTMHHGKNLRTLRLLHGMKQELFARKMGISQQRVSRMELQKTISQSKLDKAAEVLGISAETIKTLDENTLLLVATGVQPELLTGSVREMIKYYQEEISKKDHQIEHLETELNQYRDKN